MSRGMSPGSGPGVVVTVHGAPTGVMYVGAGFPAGPPREHIKFAHRFLKDVLDKDNRVRFPCGHSFFTYICHQYGFQLVQRTRKGVLPGGQHLFFVVAPVVQTTVVTGQQGLEEEAQVLWKVLLRVKTTGTRVRPRPHMTLSASTGLEWEHEHYKYNYVGLPVPKTLSDLDPNKDHWANSCHFDFGGFLPALPASASLSALPPSARFRR